MNESKWLRYSGDSDKFSQKYSPDSETGRKSGGSFLDQKYLESSQTNLSLSNIFNINENETESSGDNACGEPFVPQRIVIDFTPDENVDTEYIQNKVNDFWDFVDAHPELQACIVKPDMVSELNMQSATSSTVLSSHSPSSSTTLTVGPSAVSMVSMITKRGIINPALNLVSTRLPVADDSKNFDENKNDSSTIQENSSTSGSPPSKYQHFNHAQAKQPRAKSPYSSEEVQKLCKTLSHWDELHPKSLDPPGQSPPLLPEI